MQDVQILYIMLISTIGLLFFAMCVSEIFGNKMVLAIGSQVVALDHQLTFVQLV